MEIDSCWLGWTGSISVHWWQKVFVVENASHSHVLADVSWPTCVATASDMKRWKVLQCFSLVGHEPKVGHKTFAHGCGLKNVSCWWILVFQVLRCFMEEIKINCFYCWSVPITEVKLTYMHSNTLHYLIANTDTTSKREQTITSSGNSLSQAKLTAAHGAFSVQVHL